MGVGGILSRTTEDCPATESGELVRASSRLPGGVWDASRVSQARAAFWTRLPGIVDAHQFGMTAISLIAGTCAEKIRRMDACS